MKQFNKQILEAINRGIQLALDDYQDIEPNSSISSPNDVIDAKDIIQDKIEFKKFFVDMGFPSRTLWARYNLGVNPYKGLFTPESYYGDYYCWGEIETKPQYRPIDYKFATEESTSTFTKYNGELNDKDNLDLCDDAAYNNNPYTKFNIDICLPSSEQILELMSQTDRKLICNYKGIAGLNVVVLKSIYNNEELVFPLGGYKKERKIEAAGEFGVIMSNHMNKEYRYRSYGLRFMVKYTPNIHVDFGYEGITKYTGLNVRPVIMK